ncbi:MAG: polyprenol monophosphomannose synthase [Candidatus Woesearchaeota archaeon]|nr:polyprenol monophosphomannose synthase [Candidatus Woesearchaeota archaeon]
MISIIIPTYNEKENIKNLIAEISNIFKKNKIKGEIIIVDDNSPDGTGKIAENLSKKYSVKVLHRKGKLGLSSAVVAGFKAAKGSILGVMDADFSHPPEIIPELIKPILNENIDFVIGSRHVKGGGIENWPLLRKLISKGATLLAKTVTNVKDPMSGLFFLKKSVIKGIKFDSKGFKICLEILVKGSYKTVKEVPYIFKDRRVGKSKLGAGEYLNYVVTLARLIKYKIARK